MGRPRPSAPRQFRRRGSTARTGEQDDLLPLRLESKRSSPLRLKPSPGRRPPTDTSRRAVLARGQSPCLIHGTEAMTANCDKGPPRPARRDLTARDVGGDSSTSSASSGCRDGETGPPAGRPVAVRCRANRPKQDSAQLMSAIAAETSPKTKPANKSGNALDNKHRQVSCASAHWQPHRSMASSSRRRSRCQPPTAHGEVVRPGAEAGAQVVEGLA